MEIENDIKLMKDSIIRRGFVRQRNLWNKAFAIYNDNNSKKLSVNCYGCYSKVLNFIIQNKNLWK